MNIAGRKVYVVVEESFSDYVPEIAYPTLEGAEEMKSFLERCPGIIGTYKVYGIEVEDE